MAKKLWTPSAERINNTNIKYFMEVVNDSYNLELDNYQALWDWSVTNIEDFWASLWNHFNIIHSKNYNNVIINKEAFPPETKWFTGAKLNFAENLLRYRDDHLAFIFESEIKGPISITYKELYLRVAQLSEALREEGVGPGDRIAGYMPNLIETAIAMLAATSLGAVWSSCGSELGPDAALDRLGQVEPKVLFTVDKYTYKEKEFDQLSKAKNVATAIDSIEKVIVYPYIDESPDLDDFEISVLWDNFIKKEAKVIDFAQVEFSSPLYIMFSSGTTGKPKCMVQSVGGILINHMKELILHTDLKRETRISYLASPSWMMWNWLVSSLSVGSTIVLYEGNPLYPDWRRAWQLIEDNEINVFGCSASYLHYLKKEGAKPGEEFDLSSLEQISQTGSALSDEGFQYVYDKIKEDLHFNSISGGTDINGCFAAGVPILPVYMGQLQARALGMAVNAYDQEGNPVKDEQAELVCELPSPSMPIYFWKDEGNKRYKDAYFDYFDKQVWRHGDYIEIDSETGGVIFYGRSDSVLKPSGVRIGTAEIYNVVELLPEVKDSLAIGQEYEEDQRIILFVEMTNDSQLTDEVKKKIRHELRMKASPRHAPALIIQTPENGIPYTFSGKKVESAVTNIIHGRDVSNRGAMRNPESLDFYDKILTELN